MCIPDCRQAAVTTACPRPHCCHLNRMTTVLLSLGSNVQPRRYLHAAVAALRELQESLEELRVASARDHGWSWQQIADALQISRQAVHKKYRRHLA